MLEVKFQFNKIYFRSETYHSEVENFLKDKHISNQVGAWYMVLIESFPDLLPLLNDPKMQVSGEIKRELAAAYNESRPKPLEITETSNWIYLKHLFKHPGLYFALDEALSYPVAGAEHSIAYQKGTWDGRKHMLRKYRHNLYRLRTGLKERLLLELRAQNAKFSIYNASSLPSVRDQQPKMTWLLWEGPDLWDHQEAALIKCIDRFNGIIAIATGGGKTILMARLIWTLNMPTNIFINSVDIGKQLRRVFSDILGAANVGFIGDSDCEIRENLINVILLPTAYLALLAEGEIQKWEVKVNDEGKKEYKLQEITISADKYPAIVKCIKSASISLYDECDILGAETYSAVSACTQSPFNYGFSATPWRNDGKDLEIEAGCGKLTYHMSASDLIEKNILVPPEIHIYRIPKSVQIKSRRYPSVFKLAIKENSVRNLVITKIAKQFVAKRLVGLVTVNRIAHGQDLNRRFNQEGIRSKFIYGQDKAITRARTIQQLKHRELDVIITTLFKRGVDIPELNFGIRAEAEGVSKTGRPNSNVIQAVGRTLRKTPNKTKAYWVDFYDPYPFLKDHSQCRIDAYQSEKAFTILFKDSKDLEVN